MTTASALETLRSGPATVRAILETHRGALQEHRRQVDADEGLNEVGRAARLAELRAQANAAAAQATAELRAALAEASASVTARAQARRPAPDTGVEALMGRQVRWNRVREMLDADVPLDEVIAETADPETLHALADEIPAYLRIKGFGEAARTEVLRAVEDQLAYAAGPKALEAHTAMRETEVLTARLAPLLDHAEGVGAGRAEAGQGMVAAIRAEYAAQLAGREAAAGLALPSGETETETDDADEDFGEDIPAA